MILIVPFPERVKLTRVAREILTLADECGLHAYISTAGPSGYGCARTQVMVDSGMRDGSVGSLVIGRNRQILRGFLVHGNWGEERSYEGARWVRSVIASWDVLMMRSE